MRHYADKVALLDPEAVSAWVARRQTGERCFMADLLVKHLKEKAGKHSALSLLASQWDFDKKLIPKALQSIGGLFPHYSRHDESHSKQILINIERLLGDNIRLLSATDTWLILEAAYWHDIGMVVPHADLQKAIAEPGFAAYIDGICAQPYHELNAIARAFKSRSDTGLIFDCESPVEMLGKLRELLAEWFRRQHADRAAEIVRSPMTSIGLSSPRTELIPARLIRVLGRICQMHGAAFKDLLAPEGLPFREAGLGKDDCHPRFVACLLRMGDLLDLDDNRFCPVMQGIAGEHRPALSKAHEDKHAGMRHLRLDPERIELVAECETVDGYMEAFKWFSWLEEEVSNQRNNWRDIVPSRKLGLLPMLGPITVRLKGNLQILKDGVRPAFSLDSEKVTELLEGKNLYGSKYACIRELLQNAVDATLLKVWLTHRNDPALDWKQPGCEKLKTVFNAHAVTVTLEELDTEQDADSALTTWQLRIRDKGTGITRNDLEFMLSIGGSQRNQQRQREIRQMPEWAKPSGAFGIGLHSAFILCDEINVRTKNVVNNEIFDIVMHKPSGPNRGLVLLRKLPEDIAEPYGTEMTLRFKLDAFTQHWWSDGEDRDTVAARIARKRDPLLDESFPYEAGKLFDKVVEFANDPLIKIDGTLVTKGGRFDIADVYAGGKSGKAEGWRFIDMKDTQLKIRYKPLPVATQQEEETFYAAYRGQHFDTDSISFPLVNVEVNLVSGGAGTWLDFNRDTLSKKAREAFRRAVLEALYHTVEFDLAQGLKEQLFKQLDCTKIDYSIFLKEMEAYYGPRWGVLSEKFRDTWQGFRPGRQPATIEQFYSRPTWKLWVEDYYVDAVDHLESLRILPYEFEAMGDLIFREWLKVPGHSISAKVIYCPPSEHYRDMIGLEDGSTIGRIYFQFSTDYQEPLDKESLAYFLNKALHSSGGNSRYYMNPGKAFERLSLRADVDLRLFNLAEHDLSQDRVLVPLLFVGSNDYGPAEVRFDDEQLQRICQWTEGKLKQPMTREEMREAYQSLADFINLDVMACSDAWQKARC